MIVQGNSITECWLKVLIAMVENTSWEISPLIANFTCNLPEPGYLDELEYDLNEYLRNIGQNTIKTTASTIFPQSLSGGDKNLIYKRFDKIWPVLKKDTQNRKGHYFRRLVAFGESTGKPINQLKHIIETYNGIEGVRKPVHRRSALIALTFDPSIDHTAQAMRGFPCLQQVCFVPKKNGKMALNAMYAMQHLSNRAYGNYVGLQNLGNFMADQMGLELDEINCIASVLELGKMEKPKAKELVEKYKKYV